MGSIRFGIIGYGAQGKNYASILMGKELPGIGKMEVPANCGLSAVSDVMGNASDDFDENSGVTCYTDWKEMIDAKACDAVILTVPHFLHSEITCYALDHGMNVMCEKPAAVRASEVEEMIAASKRNPDVTFALMLNQRVNPVYRRLKEIIDSGDLGEIRRSNWIINNWWRPDSYYQSSPWRGTWKGEGGGLLVNQAPHQLDLWSWLCGQPTKIYAVCKEGAYRDIQVENDVTLVSEYENGATGTFISCTHDPMGTDRLEIDLSKGKIVVDNSAKATVYTFNKDESDWNDTMEFRMFTGTLRRDPASLYTVEEIEGNIGFGQDYAIMFTNFANHVLSGEELLAPGEEGLKAVQIANTAQLSAAYNKPLACPCDTSEYNEYLNRRMKAEEVATKDVAITNIGHASFNAKNMDEMMHFYKDIIGMRLLFTSTFKELSDNMRRNAGDNISPEMEQRLKMMEPMGEMNWVHYLKLGDRQYLELFCPTGRGRKDFENRGEFYGYQKLNYEVTDIEQMKQRLQENGVPIDKDIHTTSDDSLEIVVHDPDGNEVQFTQYSKQGLDELGAGELKVKAQEGSLARCTTQIMYRVRSSAKMNKFYCQGLGLKKVRTLTYTDLARNMEESGMLAKNPAMAQGLKAMGSLPWIDYLEVAPHQYIELMYDYGGKKKEERNLYPYNGYQHICLEVTDIHAAWDAVTANGLTCDTPISLGVDGSWQFWLVDPDGNRIELMEYAIGAKQLM